MITPGNRRWFVACGGLGLISLAAAPFTALVPHIAFLLSVIFCFWVGVLYLSALAATLLGKREMTGCEKWIAPAGFLLCATVGASVLSGTLAQRELEHDQQLTEEIARRVEDHRTGTGKYPARLDDLRDRPVELPRSAENPFFTVNPERLACRLRLRLSPWRHGFRLHARPSYGLDGDGQYRWAWR